MDLKLFVDEKEIALNEFVKKVFSGIVVGAVMSLRDIKEDWKKIRIEVAKHT